MSEIKIIEHIATIGENRRTVIEVNLASHNRKPPILDIRAFKKEDHSPMAGIYLLPVQIENLRNVLNEITMVPELSDGK